MVDALEAKLLDLLSNGPQGTANLAGNGLGKEYNQAFHGCVTKNSDSFRVGSCLLPDWRS